MKILRAYKTELDPNNKQRVSHARVGYWYKIEIESKGSTWDAALGAIESTLDELEELAASVSDKMTQADETIISWSNSDAVEFDSAKVYFMVKVERDSG